MASYSISNIVRDVKVCMDRNSTSTVLEGLGDVDTLSLNDIIESKVVEGVKIVHSNAPAHLLTTGRYFGDSIEWNEDRSGCIILPDDFMRLIVFQMSDWKRACYQALTPDNPKYLQQSSKFGGIRGNTENPVVVLAIRPEGRTLEFYSSKYTTAKINRALYMPYPKVDENGCVDISPRCYDAVIYTIASLALSALGEADKAAILSNLATTTIL